MKQVRKRQVMKNIVVFLLVYFLAGCSCSLNETEAKREQTVESGGFFYSYYTQPMWDALLMFVIKTEYKPARYIDSPNGELDIGEESIIFQTAVTESWKADRFLRVDDDVVFFCDVSDCEGISNRPRNYMGE